MHETLKVRPGTPARRPTGPVPTGRPPPCRLARGPWWWSLPALALIAAVHYAATLAGSAYAFNRLQRVSRTPEFVGWRTSGRSSPARPRCGAAEQRSSIAVAFLVLPNVLGMAFAVP